MLLRTSTCLLVIVFVLGLFSVEVSARRPHVILFVVDDLGWSDVGYRNESGMITPTMDKLVSQGVLLDRYYTQPVCSPARAALMQGRYPFRAGMQHYSTIKPASTAHLPLKQPTMAEVLRKAGYHTHHIGKWHLGMASFNYTPTSRGFESHAGYFQAQLDYYNRSLSVAASELQFTPNSTDSLTGYDWWHNKTYAKVPAGVYNVDLLKAEAHRVLSAYDESGASERDEPLFLFYAHQEGHIPLEDPPASYTERCDHFVDNPRRKTYCSMVAAMDESLNDLIEDLKRRNMWEDTLLIVTTDNGGDPDYGGASSSAGCNYPLRAGKARLFEGGVRGIGFVSGGRNVLPVERHGSVHSGLAHIVDWFPTILELANAHPPFDLDGHSLLSAVMRGASTNRTHIPLDINKKVDYPNAGSQMAILTDDGWKLILDHVHGTTLKYDGYYKCLVNEVLLAERSITGEYLFNVFHDPTEQHNLYRSYPHVVSRLRALAEQYERDYQNPQTNIIEPAGLPSMHDGVWAPFLDDNPFGGIIKV
mmetsp:Transcript_3463/g.8319  ORF Transcript_3463/g.8319 Transcript_3463/m.8319 type:complete len:532 (-) Transcript_3463:37-1632(-)